MSSWEASEGFAGGGSQLQCEGTCAYCVYELDGVILKQEAVATD